MYKKLIDKFLSSTETYTKPTNRSHLVEYSLNFPETDIILDVSLN